MNLSHMNKATDRFSDTQKGIEFDAYFLDGRLVLYVTQHRETVIVNFSRNTAAKFRSVIEQYLESYKPEPKPESNHKTAAMSARQIIEQRRKQRK